jgi:antitoxin component YwqK of YwqJK toxin-antitoxin module
VVPSNVWNKGMIEKEYWDKEEKKIWAEISFQDGQRHGVSRHWYENGQLQHESSCRNGCTHGVSRLWYRNGQLESEYVYVDGKYLGTLSEVLKSHSKLWFVLMFGQHPKKGSRRV